MNDRIHETNPQPEHAILPAPACLSAYVGDEACAACPRTTDCQTLAATLRPTEREPSPNKQTNPKDAIAGDKLPLHLWPETATAAGCIAFLNGALKYGRSNWRACGVRASVYVDAAKRHLNAWFEGEEHDPDDGVPHLSATLACIAILVDARAAQRLVDDRQHPGGHSAFIREMTTHVARLKAHHAGRTPTHYTINDLAREPHDTQGLSG